MTPTPDPLREDDQAHALARWFHDEPWHEFACVCPGWREHLGQARAALSAQSTPPPPLDVERLRGISSRATPGPWKARVGFPPDRFMPDGYKYVQFGPTEKKADGRGTDQLSPDDADLITEAVNLIRAALQSPDPGAETTVCDYCIEGLPLVDGWHIREADPDGMEAMQRIPCARWGEVLR